MARRTKRAARGGRGALCVCGHARQLGRYAMQPVSRVAEGSETHDSAERRGRMGLPRSRPRLTTHPTTHSPPQALAAYLQDPEIKTILLARDMELSDAAWAPVGSAVVTRRVLVAPVNASGRVAIDFGRLQSAIVLVGDRARLTFDRVWLKNMAPRTGVRQEGLTRLKPVGLSLWPSVVALPNTTIVLADARVDITADDGFANCSAFGERVKPEAEAAGFTVYLTQDGRDAQLAGTVTLAQPLVPPGDGAPPAGNTTIVSTDTVLTCVAAPARPGRAPTKLVALPPVNASGSVADSLVGAASTAAAPTPPHAHARLKWWAGVLLAVSAVAIAALAVGVAVLARRLRRLQKQRSMRRTGAKAAAAAAVVAAKGGDAEAGTPASARAPPAAIAPLPLLLRARSADAATDIELGPLLGRGSYGRVYKARWKGTLVAVKVVPADDLDGGVGGAAAAARESALALAATHPNVVATYKVLTLAAPPDDGRGGGSGSGDDAPSSAAGGGGGGPDRAASLPGAETWIVLEYMDRGTLEAAIRGGRFARRPPGAGGGDDDATLTRAPSTAARDAAAAWACLKDVAAGLAYLHSLGVLHGDLSTSNVLLRSTASDPRGFVAKVSDFGLSRVLDARASHVSTKTYGTVRAMPPELLRDGRMTRGADVYAFGVLAWEVWAGVPAYEGTPTAAIFYKVAVEGGRPPPLPSAPPELNALCAACWVDDPDARPSFDEVLARVTPLAAAARAAARPARGVKTGGGSTSSVASSVSVSPGGSSGGSGATATPAAPVAAPTPFAASVSTSPDKPGGGGVWGRLPAAWRRSSGSGSGKASKSGSGRPPKPPKRDGV